MKLASSTIAVTGATGFLGGYLVDALRAHGAEVVAVVRDLKKAEPLRARGVVLRRATLEDRAALSAAFHGVDAVISNAAAVGFTRPRHTMTTNVEGTRNVFEALADAGVRRAIAISSASAYPSSWFERDERAELRRGRRHALLQAYGESKALAERVARTLSARHGVALTIFRPCGITGPSDPLLMRTLTRFMQRKVTLFPAFTRIGVVHAADVANAVCKAIERSATSAGKVYNLQGNTVSLWQLANAWKAAGGAAPWLRVPIPVPLLLRFNDACARRELAFQPRSIRDICHEALRSHGSTTTGPQPCITAETKSSTTRE